MTDVQVIEISTASDFTVYEISNEDPPVVIGLPGSGGGGGGGGGTAPYVHNQPLPSAVWTINHHLGYRPSSVSVFNGDYTIAYDEFYVQHFDLNTVRLGMETPISGIALVR